ncbi:hypothetical protein [Modicisalibacter tunisiensis]|uniref:Uncharacterized protein n=1 Tax=Modicisalibacter tunisiensis TaxID=390637 RepID=A0ABS7X121_9GAMM|nr:hypothetical protein [Modicisalibacter tunisiensis]MBZ9537988.1 hypothetical protein [Modicisalibacter tunisiensis]MBZ9568595.1 hypothetical protein [Modicisalibacter tunisiensis]
MHLKIEVNPETALPSTCVVTAERLLARTVVMAVESPGYEPFPKITGVDP